MGSAGPTCTDGDFDAFAAARTVCRRERDGAGADAHVASFFLPRPKRDGVCTVWALARLIERAVTVGSGSCGGDCGDRDTSVVMRLKSRLQAMYAGTLELPRPEFRDEAQQVLAAAADIVRRFDIPGDWWLALVDGLAAIRDVARVATWRSLDERLAATGGTIARIVAAVLGARHSDAGEFASSIGRGTALASVLRGLNRDVSANRLLLPLEDLSRFRYSERELLARARNDNFRGLVRYEVERARRLLSDGARGTCWLADDGSRMAVGMFVAGQLAALDAVAGEPDVLLRENAPGAGGKSMALRIRHLPLAWKIATSRDAEAKPAT